MFLSLQDYRALIKDDILGRVINQEQALREQSELFAQELMESYMRSKYDVAQIFAQTGTTRSMLIITYMIDIVLHTLHARITPNQIPEVRVERYENALSWLKMLANGQINADLPLLNNPTQPVVSGMIFSSHPKQNFDF